jgi:hypothetical protein
VGRAIADHVGEQEKTGRCEGLRDSPSTPFRGHTIQKYRRARHGDVKSIWPEGWGLELAGKDRRPSHVLPPVKGRRETAGGTNDPGEGCDSERTVDHRSAPSRVDHQSDELERRKRVGSDEAPPAQIVAEIDGPRSFPATVRFEILKPEDRRGLDHVLILG